MIVCLKPRLCSEAINQRVKARKFTRFCFLFLYSTVYAQSDDDFLSDFGGDDFEEIESELDLVTTNVVKKNFLTFQSKKTNQ